MTIEETKKRLEELLNRDFKFIEGEGGLDLVGVDFSSLNLDSVNFRWSILSNTKFIGTILCNADLVEADLRYADLRGANLLGANLHGANLRGANLECADLERASLYSCNLENTNFFGARLIRANLEKTNLHYAIVKHAIYNDETTFPIFEPKKTGMKRWNP